MNPDVVVEIIDANQWQRLRTIRLESLKESAAAFGANFAKESEESEAQWRERFEKLDFLIATVDGKDAAVMSIEVLDGDFGATCWIGGCWSDPKYRGKGLFRALFNFIDAQDRPWKVQGLGVWTDNYNAIAAYETLGFVTMGENKLSTRVPGKYFQRMIRAPKL